MTAYRRTEAASRPPWSRRLPQIGVLAAVWMLLWGSMSVLTVLGGILVATLITVMFPLPVLPERLPFRPLRLLRLAGYLAGDLVVSAIQVSLVTLRDGPRARAGILAVPVFTRSARVVTVFAAAVALSPGSFVLQLDSRRSICYVYALGLGRPGAVDRARRAAFALQYQVLAAIGTPEELASCRRALGEVS